MKKSVELQTDTLTGAEAVVELLKAHGVEILFGLCGDTSLPFYDALARLPHGMRHILTRDERSAAYMADGYARVSGKVGVCEAPSGGGATYVLPGLAEANESSVPVLCINSDISVSARGRYTLTELDQGALMRPVTKWNAVLDRSQDIPRVFRTAFEQMTSGRPGAAHIALPFDVENGMVKRTDVYGDASLGQYPAHRASPDSSNVESAARLLGSASYPVFICGGGVVISGSEKELLKLAERLSAPVATTISGKGSINEEHPLAVGVVGSNGGTPETRAIVDRADVIVFAGCRAGSVTTERWRHPAPDKVKVIHLDVDSAVLGVNYRVDAPLVGDAKLALRALNEALATTKRPLEASAVQKAKAEKFAKFQALAQSDEKPVKPERLVAELARALDKDAILVADAGTPCPYFSAYFQVRGTGRRFISNRAHGALFDGDGSVDLLVAARVKDALIVLLNQTRAPAGWFQRGDVTRDGAIDLTDPLQILESVFSGTDPFSCPDAADVNDDGVVVVSDAIDLLNYLFQGSLISAAPGPVNCGADPTGDFLSECLAGDSPCP